MKRKNNDTTSAPSLNALREEIKLLLRYAAPEEYQQEAVQFVDRYDGDKLVLNILHCFYSFLPEGLDDAVTEIRLMENKEGAFIFAAKTLQDTYLYLATTEQAEFLGIFTEGVWDQEVLRFFNFTDRLAFTKKHAHYDQLTPYQGAHLTKELCSFCKVARGEHHILGCPVEICPWCGGQLTTCNCRFTKLNKQSLSKEADLEKLLKLLNEKGRIPFDPDDQVVSYPTTPNELAPPRP